MGVACDITAGQQIHLKKKLFSEKMAPVGVDVVHYDIMAPVKNLKVVEKAFGIPVVNTVFNEIASISSPVTPYVKSTVTTITPMTEVVLNTIKTKVKENVVPHLSEGAADTAKSTINGAVAQLTDVLERVDDLACGGVDQLLDKVPALKEATPKLIEDTKEMTMSYINDTSTFAASFSLAQVALKILDSGLDGVENIFKFFGGSEDNLVATSIEAVHTKANMLRVNGNIRAGTEKAKRIEEASILGALLEALGLNRILDIFGLNGKDSAAPIGDLILAISTDGKVKAENENESSSVRVGRQTMNKKDRSWTKKWNTPTGASTNPKNLYLNKNLNPI